MAEKHIQTAARSVAETRRLGQTLGAGIQQPIVIALTGDLGSGKTAFVQGLANGLDVPRKYYITSPTFTLINEYPGRCPLYHVDLYRIEDRTEFEDIGLGEVLQADAVIVVEWAEKLSPAELAEHLALRFKIINENARQIDIFAYGHRPAILLKALKHQLLNRPP